MSGQSGFEGILPAMILPLNKNMTIDRDGLRQLACWLAGHEGIGGLVTNGHTGEVFALSPQERAQVTATVAAEVAGKLPVISGICAEGIGEAVEQAKMARDAGASGLLVMPPHYWLRFGMQTEHVLDHFKAIGEASGLSLVVHIYPAWTRASYSCALLEQLVRLPHVHTVKIGTRELSKYDRDIAAIRASNPACKILTCHDEYLLPTMVQGVDGALVGFASLIPAWIVELYRSVCEGDLKRGQAIQRRINVLKEAVYADGEPSGDAHARLKTAMMMAGLIGSDWTRPPIRPPAGGMRDRIRAAVEEVGLLVKSSSGH